MLEARKTQFKSTIFHKMMFYHSAIFPEKYILSERHFQTVLYANVKLWVKDSSREIAKTEGEQ